MSENLLAKNFFHSQKNGKKSILQSAQQGCKFERFCRVSSFKYALEASLNFAQLQRFHIRLTYPLTQLCFTSDTLIWKVYFSQLSFSLFILAYINVWIVWAGVKDFTRKLHEIFILETFISTENKKMWKLWSWRRWNVRGKDKGMSWWLWLVDQKLSCFWKIFKLWNVQKYSNFLSNRLPTFIVTKIQCLMLQLKLFVPKKTNKLIMKISKFLFHFSSEISLNSR